MSADPIKERQDELEAIHEEYILVDDPGADEETPRVDGDATVSGFDGSDEDLIEKAKNAENGDKFTRLWNGDISGYPSHSEADLALCDLLAFWTAGDRQRINSLFRNSGLFREKWERDDYRQGTIGKALENRTEFYEPQPNGDGQEQPPPDPSESIKSGMDLDLTPAGVAELTSYNPDGDSDIDGHIADLSDREKAAAVWEIVQHTDDFHLRVRRDNSSLWAFDAGVWKSRGERALRHAARQALGAMHYGQNVLSELKAQARSDPRVEIAADEFGVETGTLAVENGLLYLDAAADGAGPAAIRDLEPGDYALAKLPVEYDPQANYSTWTDYVDEWAEDGRADALQEFVGYCLHIGAMPVHRALLLVGSGANGKGTFLAVVRALLGRENTTSIELQTLANERDAVADFYGSLANIDDDLSPRKLGQGVGMFKKLVGGDRVRARHLYEDGFEFDATGKHLYAANEVPDVDVPDDDEAFWRRWLLVEFPNHYAPSDRDHNLRDQLTKDDVLSGVLNWAIEGWRRLLEQGHFTGEAHYAHAKRERWQAWGESVDQFISECVERDPDAPRMTTADAHRHYAAWCRANGEEPVGQRKLTTALKKEDVGYSQSLRVDGHDTPQRGYKALGLSDDVPTPNDDAPAQESIV